MKHNQSLSTFLYAGGVGGDAMENGDCRRLYENYGTSATSVNGSSSLSHRTTEKVAVVVPNENEFIEEGCHVYQIIVQPSTIYTYSSLQDAKMKIYRPLIKEQQQQRKSDIDKDDDKKFGPSTSSSTMISKNKKVATTISKVSVNKNIKKFSAIPSYVIGYDSCTKGDVSDKEAGVAAAATPVVGAKSTVPETATATSSDVIDEQSVETLSFFKEYDLISLDMIVTCITPNRNTKQKSNRHGSGVLGVEGKDDVIERNYLKYIRRLNDENDNVCAYDDATDKDEDDTDKDIDKKCNDIRRNKDSEDDSKNSDNTNTSHTILAQYGRLSDQSGWICLYENNITYCTNIPIENNLYSFYVDNIPLGITVRYHPLDDTTNLLPTERRTNLKQNNYNDTSLLHIEPITKIYCDCKVTNPKSGIHFYRLQFINSTYYPMWVYDKQPSLKPDYDPDIYKLLPSSKITNGYYNCITPTPTNYNNNATTTTKKNNSRIQFLYAYQVLLGTVVRNRPDCTEESKIMSCILQPNDIIVGTIIRQSPCPQNGNGPFIRLALNTTNTTDAIKDATTVGGGAGNNKNYNDILTTYNNYNYWVFEKKLHQNVLKPLPKSNLIYGYWEFQIVLNQNSIDTCNARYNKYNHDNDKNSGDNNDDTVIANSNDIATMLFFRTGIYVYNQPLDRCLSTSESTIAFLRVGEYVQCDCKIEQPKEYYDNDDNNDDDEGRVNDHAHEKYANNNTTEQFGGKCVKPITVAAKSKGINKMNYYYRVILSDGRYGWVSDKDWTISKSGSNNCVKQKAQPQAKLRQLSSHINEYQEYGLCCNMSNENWTPEFVRYVVMASSSHNNDNNENISSVKEIAYQPVGNVLMFQNITNFITIIVFCSTKTVITTFEHSIDYGASYDHTTSTVTTISSATSSAASTKSFDVEDYIHHHDVDPTKQAMIDMMKNHDSKVFKCYRDCTSGSDLYGIIMNLSIIDMMTHSMDSSLDNDNKDDDTMRKISTKETDFDDGSSSSNDDLTSELTNSSMTIQEEIQPEKVNTNEFIEVSYDDHTDYLVGEDRKETYINKDTGKKKICSEISNGILVKTSLSRRKQASSLQEQQNRGTEKKTRNDINTNSTFNRDCDIQQYEIDIRMELLSCDYRIQQMQKRRNELWGYIQLLDNHRISSNSFDENDHLLNSSLLNDRRWNSSTRKKWAVQEYQNTAVVTPSLMKTNVASAISNMDDFHNYDRFTNYDDDGRVVATIFDAEGFEIVKKNSFDTSDLPVETSPATTSLIGDDAIVTSTRNRFHSKTNTDMEIKSFETNSDDPYGYHYDDGYDEEGNVKRRYKNSLPLLPFVERTMASFHFEPKSKSASRSGHNQTTTANSPVITPGCVTPLCVLVGDSSNAPRIMTNDIQGLKNEPSMDASVSLMSGSNRPATFSVNAIKRTTTSCSIGNNTSLITTSGGAVFLSSSSHQQRRGLVCGECFQMFSGKYSRDIHCREVHQLYCKVCDKTFPSSQELKIHRCLNDE